MSIPDDQALKWPTETARCLLYFPPNCLRLTHIQGLLHHYVNVQKLRLDEWSFDPYGRRNRTLPNNASACFCTQFSQPQQFFSLTLITRCLHNYTHAATGYQNFKQCEIQYKIVYRKSQIENDIHAMLSRNNRSDRSE